MGFLDKILAMFKKESPIEGSIDGGPIVTGGSADGAEIVGDQSAKTVNFPEQPVQPEQPEQPEQPKEDVVDMAGSSADAESEPTSVESGVIAEEPVESEAVEEEVASAEVDPTSAEINLLEKVEEVKQAPVSNPATSIEELEAKIGTGAEPEIMAQEGGPEETDNPEE